MTSLRDKNISCMDCNIDGKDIIRREKDLFFNYEDVKEAVLEFKERYFDREIYCKELGESIFDEIFGDYGK